jgi:hypothetical protein
MNNWTGKKSTEELKETWRSINSQSELSGKDDADLNAIESEMARRGIKNW